MAKLESKCENCKRRYGCFGQLAKLCKMSEYSQFEQDPEIAKEGDYIARLKRRDTPVATHRKVLHTSDETGKEYVYVLCPQCSGVLNRYDRFCRFCGQRVRRDNEKGGGNYV